MLCLKSTAVTVKLPAPFIEQLKDVWTQEQIDNYLAAFETEVHSIRIHPKKGKDLNTSLNLKPVPWCENGFYLDEKLPYTWDPAFQAGYYYVQEAASMAIERAFKSWRTKYTETEIVGLDACAAPGGKSTHLLSLLEEDRDVLISNEPIPKRRLSLQDNLQQWGYANSLISPFDFTRSGLEIPVDFLLVDAPCSGEGMFRKEAKAIEEWSPENVLHCAWRQKEILSRLIPAIKKNGLLMYSTCTFNRKENEEIAAWIISQGFEPLEFEIDGKGVLGNNNSYRFSPGNTLSEGFFLSAFIKQEACSFSMKEFKKPKPVQVNDIEPKGQQVLEIVEQQVYLGTQNAQRILLQNRKVLRYSMRIGEVLRDQLRPSSTLVYLNESIDQFPTYQLDEYEQAIAFLEGKSLQLDSKHSGFTRFIFKNIPLGFGKLVKGRVNNLREKHLRIKQQLTSQELQKLSEKLKL